MSEIPAARNTAICRSRRLRPASSTRHFGRSAVSGLSRQIAGELNVSVSTVHEDITAELWALRDRTQARTEDFRDLEVLRMDRALRALHSVMQGNDDALRVL